MQESKTMLSKTSITPYNFDAIKNEDVMDLDISWIKENEILNAVQENRIREPCDSIKIMYIYIDRHSSIIDIVATRYTFDIHAIDRILYKCKMSELVNIRKNHMGIKYTLFDTLLYNVEVDPFNINDYSNRFKDAADGFLNPVCIENDIIIPPSIFIFHDVNMLFVLFKESIIVPKSILKNTTKSFKTHNSIALTKKVKISVNNVVYPPRKYGSKSDAKRLHGVSHNRTRKA